MIEIVTNITEGLEKRHILSYLKNVPINVPIRLGVNSNDSVLGYLLSKKSELNNVSLYNTDKKENDYAVRNSLLKEVEGSHIIILNAKDMALNSLFETLNQYIDDDVVRYKNYYFSDQTNKLYKPPSDQLGYSKKSLMFSKRVLDTLGGYKTDNVNGDDDFIHRLNKTNFNTILIDEMLYIERNFELDVKQDYDDDVEIYVEPETVKLTKLL